MMTAAAEQAARTGLKRASFLVAVSSSEDKRMTSDIKKMERLGL